MFAGFYSFRPQALDAKNIVCYDTFFGRARCYVSKQIECISIFPSSPQGRASVCYGQGPLPTAQMKFYYSCQSNCRLRQQQMMLLLKC